MMANPAEARRGGFMVYSSGVTITQIADLPDDGPTGQANLGWKHEQFAIFWMPLWAGEGSYVVYEETTDSFDYQDITPEQAQELGTATGLEVSPPGFLSLYWGWAAILGIVVVLGGLSRLVGDDDDD
jgi:hypothetical protein